ncbi:SH3 domain-binding protein 4 [Xenopus tropicalis]|uniref:SH3 domain-binding protein 4 n=2 Tax=Silurana TaxID=8363 RepID=SH3B4_XENTR|nr:SH3 domain-binding protein 4 [Xenopus tropicalis]Q5U228.1 RecName: Full=SH3 domain-binding protein 4 [Xenopus tropicalis]AAH86304.1 SH3-domain binding protein 4 [Xenopus tropicalis]|eukprot:NP_001011179.1 SH3 domain-binding protein 4 [Xenopus tropicalis]
MAAQKIRSANTNGLPRCKSEGALIDFSGVPDPNLSDVKVLSPSSLRVDNPASLDNVKEVVAIKDYCPNNFTTLKFSKGEHLYVLDTSGGEWWYAHNTTEMGYIPSSYVQPLNYRDSCLSDSGMIDGLLESVDEGVKELDLLGDWTETISQDPIKKCHNNPFLRPSVSNPFLNGPLMPQIHALETGNSVDLLLFDPLAPSHAFSSETSTDVLLDLLPNNTQNEVAVPVKRDNPFFRSKRSYSLSELSVLQAKSENPTTGSFFAGLKSPAPEQFQSREDFRTAWLNHRKLARSCHDLDLLGQNPGWGQTQPVETSIVCRLDSSGGAVQLPDTNISIHVPEKHVASGETQQISLKALLDPPLELNNDKCTTVSPVLEIKLSNMDVQSPLTLELRISVALGGNASALNMVGIKCLRSDAKEGPYNPVTQIYIYGDTVQVKLDNLEPVMYVVMVAQGQGIVSPSSVWEYINKKVTVGLYGPKHIHPSFKAVLAIFGHDCAPKTLLVNEVGQQANNSAPVTLQLWGKQQFVLPKPQDLQLCLFSNMTNYRVDAGDQGKMVRGFQLKLGKVSRLIFPIICQEPAQLSDFTLRVQVRDEVGGVLSQYCVQTPRPPPKTGNKSTGPRRFLKKKEVGKIVLSPLAVTCKYPTFQDRPVTSLKYGKLLKTVVRQSKNPYLLEYKKGDVIGLLSEEKIRLKGQLWNKEWYIGYYQGKLGLVHAKNVLVVGKVKPSFFSGPELTTGLLLEQMLRPCKFLTYIYASVRTLLMENIGSWRCFADALGYGNLPLSYFCRVELESETERVASVLEKLKEECNSEGKEKKSFQKELIMALLKIDCQGLVVRLIQDFVLLTTAVEVASRWRELAEKLARVSKQQMDGYEAPHRDRNGALDSEAMWKPAYDFLLTWSAQIGESYRDVIQELHTGLDKMRSPITKRWKHLTGTLILVNSLDILRAAAFSTQEPEDCII